jgi:excisionase family DNA binding protein
MELRNAREAARELKVSIHTLRSWMYQKKLPYVKLGRKCLFKQEDLEAFVNRSVVKPKGDVWNIREAGETRESKKQKRN